MLRALVRYLRDNRQRIVREVEVVQQVYDPTYGLSEHSTTIDVVDFDALVESIDDFAREFKEGR